MNSDNDVEVSTGVGSAGLATLFALGLVLVAVRRKPITPSLSWVPAPVSVCALWLEQNMG